MDITPLQWVSMFAAGSAGTLSMVKLLQALERRRNKQRLEQGHGDGQAIRDLFPNGEKAQMLRAIRDLQRENEARRDENAETNAIVRRIEAHLKLEG